MGFKVVLNDSLPFDAEFISYDYSNFIELYDGVQYIFAVVPINAEVDWYNKRVRAFSDGNLSGYITVLFATNHSDMDKHLGYREYLSEKNLISCYGRGERKIVCIFSIGKLATVGDYVIRKKKFINNYCCDWALEEHLNNSVSTVEQSSNSYIGVPQLNFFEQVTISTNEALGVTNSYTVSARTDEDGVEIFAGYN